MPLLSGHTKTSPGNKNIRARASFIQTIAAGPRDESLSLSLSRDGAGGRLYRWSHEGWGWNVGEFFSGIRLTFGFRFNIILRKNGAGKKQL